MDWQFQSLYIVILGGGFLYLAYFSESELPGSPLTGLFAIPGAILVIAGLLHFFLNALIIELRK